MAAQGYEEDYDAYDDDDESEEDDEWGLLYSSPSSSPPPAAATATATARALKATTLPISPQCSMDDDSSTEGEEVVPSASQARRRVPSASRITVSTPSSFASSEQQPAVSDQFQATTVHQRKAQIKELELKYQQECQLHCRTLLALQRQWRQELEDPVPGLISFDYLQQEAAIKQKDIFHSKSDTQIQSSIVAVPKSRATSVATSNFKNAATPDVASSLKRLAKAPLRRRLAWRSNEREAIRRGILMFGVGRSEKVRGVMRGSVKQMQHGLGDIADCCWEFVRACSVYSDLKESAFVEKLLGKAKDLGIEVGPEVTERVGQWERMEKSGSVWLKRIKLLDNLGHVVRLCANPGTQKTAYNAIDSLGDATLPCDWWTRESDLALLAGIYKHGFGSYESLRMDEQFVEAFGPSFEEKVSVGEAASGRKDLVANSIDQNNFRKFPDHDSDAELNARDSNGDSSWPDSNALTRRLKRLVEHIGRIGEQAVDIQKGSGRKVRHGQIWSKREKLNFLRILLTWGLPVIPGQGGQVSWQFFKDQASVRPLKSKKESSLEACYDGLLKEMTQLLEGSDLQEAQQSGSVDHEGSSDDSDDKGHFEFGEPSQAGPAVLTQKTAVRLKERLELFVTLRQAADLFPEDWRNVGLTVQQSHNLPSWWQSGNHDRQLATGVLKHGFGNWDAIFEDDTYTFKADFEREKFKRGLSQDGENQSGDLLWEAQNSQQADDYLKTKGKRSFSQVGPGLSLPCPKSCVKRLKFIGSILRRQLQKHIKMQAKRLPY